MLAILTAEKSAFKRSEVIIPSLKNYKELCAANLLKAVLPNPGLPKYLPDKAGKSYKVN